MCNVLRSIKSEQAEIDGARDRQRRPVPSATLAAYRAVFTAQQQRRGLCLQRMPLTARIHLRLWPNKQNITENNKKRERNQPTQQIIHRCTSERQHYTTLCTANSALSCPFSSGSGGGTTSMGNDPIASSPGWRAPSGRARKPR